MQAKRFIAGAVCPKCQLVDKLRLEILPMKQVMDCVHCGYISTLETNRAIYMMEEEKSS